MLKFTDEDLALNAELRAFEDPILAPIREEIKTLPLSVIIGYCNAPQTLVARGIVDKNRAQIDPLYFNKTKLILGAVMVALYDEIDRRLPVKE